MEENRRIREERLFQAFLVGKYLATPVTKIDYLYSNNGNKESPFYYDIVKVYGNPYPVFMPVPVLIQGLGLDLPLDDELRSDPDARVLEVAYALRKYEFKFNIGKIISKKSYLKKKTK